jgi:hypothetical protein
MMPPNAGRYDAVPCAASNMGLSCDGDREITACQGIDGFAFDMNVALATFFGIQTDSGRLHCSLAMRVRLW